MKNQPSLLRQDVTSMRSRARWHFFTSSLLLGFLLFLVNLFAWLAFFSSQTSESLEDKLGMFFYIKDYESFDDQIYTAVIRLQDEIATAGMEAQFISKDQAINNLLGERNPVLIDKLQNIGIGNPLPATLYVTFANEQDLIALKKLLVPYRNIITNAGSLSSLNSLADQEARNVRAINTGRIIQYFSYGLMCWLLLVSLLLLVYFLRTTLSLFDEEIVVKKELGVSYHQIIVPFVINSLFLLITAWIVMVALSIVAGVLFSGVPADFLWLEWFSLFGGYLYALWWIGLLELLALLVIWGIVSSWYVRTRLS